MGGLAFWLFAIGAMMRRVRRRELEAMERQAILPAWGRTPGDQVRKATITGDQVKKFVPPSALEVGAQGPPSYLLTNEERCQWVNEQRRGFGLEPLEDRLR